MARARDKRGPGKAERASKKAKAKERGIVCETSKAKGKGKGRGRPKNIETSESSGPSAEEDEENDKEPLEASSQSQSSADSDGIESTKQLLKELQSMVEKAEKKDDFEKEFGKEVREEERRLLGLLEDLERERQSERESFHNEISSLIAEALAPTRLDDDDEQGTPISSSSSPASSASTEGIGRSSIKFPAMEDHPLYIASRTLMGEFQALLTECDEVNNQTANSQMPDDLSEVWEKDYAEVRRLISLGRKATEAEVNRLLTYDPKSRHSKGNRKRKQDIDEFARDDHLQAMLEMGREGRKRNKKVYGWGNATHRLEKGFRHLIRALPDDDD